ncbi:baseplate J/gp47 family protein [Latilactobacillus sp. 5-91]|uniref:baseplate J/gp47 family protein n=1 Tax=Latilactobacillus sp. 5-91 TaxID=3410924 RepID=UPI003C78E1D5
MLDKNGFIRPTYAELVEQLTAKWLQLFGENANTAANSVGGIFIRLMAFFLNKVYELAELVYQSQFIDSATGPTLDQLAANLGLVRQAPQTAIGDIKIYGLAGYSVKAGTLFQTKDGLNYVTSEDITLVDTGKKQLNVEGFGTITYNNQNIGIGDSTVLYANGTGSKFNKPESIVNYPTNQVTPVEEVLAVQVGNLTGGADLETDDALRSRLEQASQEAPSSPYNGVISAVHNVVGVNAVKIVSNDTLVADSAGNPPKTLHIYVDGGYKDDIAKAILESVAAGVQTYGGILNHVKDIGGTTHDVYFDKPTPLSIFAKIKVTTNDSFPLQGNDQIKQAVLDYISSVGMGEMIYYSYLYRFIYDNVPGIVVADVKIGTSKDQLTAADIQLTDIQRATITADSVVVE